MIARRSGERGAAPAASADLARPFADIYPGGDSMTKCAAQQTAWRGYLLEQFALRGLRCRMVGTAADGLFGNNEHSGYSGRLLSQIATRSTDECGAGHSFTGCKGAILAMVGTNDLQDGTWVDVDTWIASWTACVLATHNAIVSTVPGARILVTTLPNFEATAGTYQRQQDSNAALPAAVTTWNTAHPNHKLFYADIAAAIGAWSDANYLDSSHLRNAGNLIAGAAMIDATDADAQTWVSYLSTL